MDDEDFEKPVAMDPEDDEYEAPPEAAEPTAPSETDDLEDLAANYGIPGPREAYAQLATSAENARNNLKQARERILARKYNNAGAWFAASAALGAPTRTGSIGEAFANLSSALAPVSRDRQEFEQQRDKDLLGVDTDISGIDERMAMNAMKLAQLMKKSKSGPDDSAAVRTFRYLTEVVNPEGYARMTPQERANLFFETLRNPNMWVGKVNEGVMSFDPLGRRATRVLSTTDSEIDAQRRLAGSKAEAVDLGQAAARAKIDLPKLEDNANALLGQLDAVKNHPGKKWVVGWPEGVNLGVVPRTKAKGFQTRMDQIGGQQFLQAYEYLKSAGAITEIEGQTAKKAQARMQTAQRPEDFDEAIEEYKAIIRNGVQRLRKQTLLLDKESGGSGSGGPKTPTSKVKVIKFDAQGNEL